MDQHRPGSPWTAPAPGPRTFPASFSWGVATSSYQIEGAADVDGRGDSIWDAFARVPGAIVDGSDGSVAVDHYHRVPEDVALMRELGLDAYRFSTSWARVAPDGRTIERRGVDLYSRLVDELLEAGITPWLTLYHWDMPQALEELGGWRSRDTVDRFVEYAATMHDALGDRVTRWTTLNEPWCSAFLGYAGGQHAPGVRDDVGSLRAMHHLLLAHGRTVSTIRAADPSATVGVTLNFSLYEPLDATSDADVDMARRLSDAMYGCFADPVFRGEYPAGFLADTAEIWPEDLVHDGDLAEISAPVDVLGVNYYNSWVVAAPGADAPGQVAPSGADADAAVSPWLTARDSIWVETTAPRTDMDWECHPGAFRDLLVRLHERYTAPAGAHLLVTENGAAYPDDRVVDGHVEDDDRVAYLEGHLAAVADAIDAGADVRGYMLWTLLDNFEWAYGYTKNFGIVHVDRETLARTPKASARWYADLARTRTLTVREG